jgi:hypothetical protein
MTGAMRRAKGFGFAEVNENDLLGTVDTEALTPLTTLSSGDAWFALGAVDIIVSERRGIAAVSGYGGSPE